MNVYVTIPDAVEDLNVLVYRLKTLFQVTAIIQSKRIRMSGSPEQLFRAQNYALRFIGPESVMVINVGSECFQLFLIPSLIQHFEDIYHVFILVQKPQELMIKGPKEATKHFYRAIKHFETQCVNHKRSMTSFKQDNLKLLCQKFRVQFDQLPPVDALRIGLLLHFCSIIEPSFHEGLKEKANQKPPYVEAYRKVDRKESAASIPVTDTVTPVPSSKINKQVNSSRINTPSPPSHAPVSAPSPNPAELRSVVIDGSNVAFAHGNQQYFSSQGIGLAIDFFLKRGHTNVVAVVPRFRRGIGGDLFDELERAGHLSYSSSRYINDARQVADDDRIILQLAAENDAVVVSNDQFRQYRDEDERFKDVIDNRLLQYTMALNTFLVPDDPHGPSGPSLDECLRIPKSTETEKIK